MESTSTDLASGIRLVVTRLARRLRQQSIGDITASQYSALSSIEKPGELTLGELAAIERVAPPSMTRIAARLEEIGLVRRWSDPDDRRVARVALTEQGVAVLADARSRRDLFLAARLAELSDDERQTLARAMPIFERLAGDCEDHGKTSPP